MTNLGDKIAAVATPIARALNLDCIDPETNQLRPESRCNKDRQDLNAGKPLLDVLYDRWFAAKQKGEKMKYQIIVVVDAEKMSEAVLKGESIGDVLSTQIKPAPQVRPNPTGLIPQRPQ